MKSKFTVLCERMEIYGNFQLILNQENIPQQNSKIDGFVFWGKNNRSALRMQAKKVI